jgi:hypothetical protein
VAGKFQSALSLLYDFQALSTLFGALSALFCAFMHYSALSCSVWRCSALFGALLLNLALLALCEESMKGFSSKPYSTPLFIEHISLMSTPPY